MKINRTTHILFITLIIVIVFSGSLKNDFAWDDKYLITGNPYVKSWSYVPKIFTSHLYEGSEMSTNFYRPFQSLSFIIDYSIWKLNPFGYHLTNLFLHMFNSTLIYLIVIAVSSSSLIALLAALMFGISPVISGVTYYIPARADLLMVFFVLMSVLFFIKHTESRRGRSYLVVSIASFIMSLLSKEMAMILPFLLAMNIFLKKSEKKKPIKSLLPYFIILLIYVLLRATVFDFIKGPNKFIDYSFPASIPLWRRLLTDFNVVVTYARLLLFPFDLYMQRFIRPAIKLFEINVLLPALLIALLAFITRRLLRYNRMFLYGVAWFFICLVPVLNIYPISVFLHEMWLYLPSVGFFIALSVIFQDVVKRRAGKILSGIFITAFLIYCALFTISYGKTWKDSIAVYNNILKYRDGNPFIYLVYDNLAMAYYDKGELQKSAEYCGKSISVDPKRPEAYCNMGVAYMAAKKPVKAIKYFKKAIKLKKDYTPAYCNLGHAYSSIGFKNRAMELSRAAIFIEPDSYKAYCNLGYVYSKNGDIDKAIELFKKAGEIKGEELEAHYCLGPLYIKKHSYKEALDEYNKVLKSGGLDDFGFYNALAFVYIKNKKFQESERALLRSLALNSNQFEPHNNLGNLYSMFGHFDLAVCEYRKGLEIYPDNAGIFNNIKKAKAGWKKALMVIR